MTAVAATRGGIFLDEIGRHGSGATPAAATRGAAAGAPRSTASRLVARLVELLDAMHRRRQDVATTRRNGPLSHDDAWVGGWYARNGAILEAALPRDRARTPAVPAVRRQHWDDRLD